MEKCLKYTLEDGKFVGVSEKTSKTMSAIRGKNNKTTELRMRMLLVRNKISGWVLHYKGIKGKPDFFFPHLELAIFVDGCYWHGCPTCGHIPKTRSKFWETKIGRNQERDREVVRVNEARGITVLRFWEHELHTTADQTRVIEKVTDTITALSSKGYAP